MLDKFNKWFYGEFIVNPTNYNVEFGKIFNFSGDSELRRTITISDISDSSFNHICKIIYKKNEYATIGFELENTLWSELVDEGLINEFIFAIEDCSGKSTTDFYD